MKVNLGYVAIALNLADGSPNKTVTYSNLKKIPENDWTKKLYNIAKYNIDCQKRILEYNIANDIKVFRMTSKLIPLATHESTYHWDYINDFKNELEQLGIYIRTHKILISAHPDHFTLLNSPKEEVLKNSIKDLQYHDNLFTAMNLPEAKLVIHVGGVYDDKKSAINRFIENFELLPTKLKKRIVLENDDKSYTARDVLKICQKLFIPMVFDVHHHFCHNNGENITMLWREISETWGNDNPKIHISSPKDSKNIRAHADFINSATLLEFLKVAKNNNKELNVMIEAKQKDRALLFLAEALKINKEVEFCDKASFII